MKLSEMSRARTFMLYTFIFFVVVVTILIIYLSLFKGSISSSFIIPIFTLLPLFMPIVSFYFGSKGIEEERRLREENEKLSQRIENNQNSTITDSVQLQLNEIKEYYIYNRKQAMSSYVTSTIAIFIGLCLIAFSIVYFIISNNKDLQTTSISGINGITLEFIGGSFFVLYRKTQEQLSYFYNQLIETQNIMLAMKLVQELPSEEKKLELLEKIISTLLERKPNAPVFSPDLQKQASPQQN